MMEHPLGIKIKDGMNSRQIDFKKLFSALSKHRFSGYLALAIMTGNGVEEGTLFFKDGEVLAATYDYPAKERRLEGEEALRRAMNALAGDAIFDIYELEAEDVLALREENAPSFFKYKEDINELPDLLPESFSETEVDEKTKSSAPKPEKMRALGGISKEEVLKKYGISHPDDRAVDTILGGILNDK